MNCIIIEDQPPAQRILKKYIKDIKTLELKATFSDAIQAFDFLKTEAIDLIFLDIHLPKISGIDFLKIMTNPPLVILTTAFPNYALESYEFDVVDYLLKPFSFQRFIKAVTKAEERKNTPTKKNDQSPLSNRKEIFIKSGYEHIKIVVDDLIYIKSDSDYAELFLENKKHLSSKPLRYWEENLDQRKFARIHKSYIINLSKIEKIATSRVFLFPKITLPIGRVYKESLLEHLEKHK